ncbi:MAG: S-layer protein [Betaproteobacteria bacterium]|nr:S-layer protein [Betaproteobacteria bacterium]
MREAVLGWDVGGAHLKAALVDADGAAVLAVELPCPLWQGVSHLEGALDATLARMPTLPTTHVVTMTGELADCFADRAAGVAAIVGAICARVPVTGLHLFAGRAGFVPAAAAATAAAQIASANWLATAMYLATVTDAALLADIGSTTTDLVPIAGSEVRCLGHDDFTRLATDELVYTGTTRTPLMSIAPRVPFEGRQVALMAEHFATTADVYRLTGELAEPVDLHPAADGGPKTREASARRIARMIGRDAGTAPPAAWTELARFFAEQQLERLQAAARLVIARAGLPHGAPLVGAGTGAFLARKLASRLDRPYTDFAALATRSGASEDDLMACAPAFAVARLFSAAGARR